MLSVRSLCEILEDKVVCLLLNYSRTGQSGSIILVYNMMSKEAEWTFLSDEFKVWKLNPIRSCKLLGMVYRF